MDASPATTPPSTAMTTPIPAGPTLAAPPHVISERIEHTHTVILLHGRDSTAAEFATELFQSEATEPAGQPRTLPDLFPSIRWVFPSAAIIPSQRFKQDMSQWFDMWSVTDPAERSEMQVQGLAHSINNIANVIRTEALERPIRNIFLGGISQGFATALTTFMATNRNSLFYELAGLIGMSSWMPPDEVLDKLADQHSLRGADSWRLIRTPVFLAHNRDDEVVDVKLGREMERRLAARFINVQFHSYENGGHWVNEPKGIDDLAAFIKGCMRTPE